MYFVTKNPSNSLPYIYSPWLPNFRCSFYRGFWCGLRKQMLSCLGQNWPSVEPWLSTLSTLSFSDHSVFPGVFLSGTPCTLVVISGRYFSRVDHHDEVSVHKLIHGQLSVSILVEAVKDVFRSRLRALLAHLAGENQFQICKMSQIYPFEKNVNIWACFMDIKVKFHNL